MRDAYREALAAYRQALELTDAEADPPFYGVVLHDIADVLRAQGELEEAVRLYRQAADHKQRGDASLRSQATTIRALGLAYEGLGDRGVRDAYREALAAYRQALELTDAEADPRFYGVVLHDIADVLRAQGELEEAVRLYQQAADHKQRGDASARDQGVTLRALAEVQQELGRPGEAVRAGTEAVRLLRASAGSEPRALAEALVLVARIQLQADPGQAVPLLEEAGRLLALEGVGQPAERVAVLDLLAGAYRSLGQDDKVRETVTAGRDMLAVTVSSFNISWPWNGQEDSIASTSNEISDGRLYIVLNPGSNGLRFNRRLVRFTEGPRYKDLDISRNREPQRHQRRDRRPLVISLPYVEGSIEKVSCVVIDNVCTVIVSLSSPGTRFRPGDAKFSRDLPVSGEPADGILAGAQDVLAGEDVAALLGLGQVLTERGELGLAGTALGRAGAVLQARPAGQAAEARGVLAGLAHALGRAHERRQAYPEALAAYRQALELTDAEADPRFYGVVLHDIAGVLRAQGELEEAVRLYQQAADHKQRGDADPDDIVVTVLSLAQVQQELGQPGEAVRAGTEAVRLLRASAGSEPRALAEALVFVARIQLQADPGQAVPLLEEAAGCSRWRGWASPPSAWRCWTCWPGLTGPWAKTTGPRRRRRRRTAFLPAPRTSWPVRMWLLCWVWARS